MNYAGILVKRLSGQKASTTSYYYHQPETIIYVSG